MKELTKVLNRIMRTHRWPNEIWSNGGPPCNSEKWPEMFNQNLKLVILAADTRKRDTEGRKGRKKRYNKNNRTRNVEVKVRDWA